MVLIALLMFFGYIFVDVLSPLQTLLETERGWSPTVFGTYGGSEFFLNVFAFFLIFAGIILDKTGVRFSGILAGTLMLIGAGIKIYGISDYFVNGGIGWNFFNSFAPNFPASAKVACLGFAIFGCGMEMAGVTVSRAIAKWFKGKELAMAMGIEMAIARLGVFAVFRLSPWLANGFGSVSVVRPLAVCGILLCVGFVCYLAFCVMDRKLDKQLEDDTDLEPAEEFKLKDIGKLLSSKPFLIIAFLCVLYYSAIFPFQRFATGMLQSRLDLDATSAAALFSWFPIGAMILTPLLGAFIDYKGKGASMLMIGAILMCGCHLIFALAPLTMGVAYAAIILLGISFSLVPASLWPSVPKLVEERYMGSAYSVIFWIQNVGLWGVPILIGWSLAASNPDVSAQIKDRNEYVKEIEAEIIDLRSDITAGMTFSDIDERNIFIDNNPRMITLQAAKEDVKSEVQVLTKQYKYTAPMLIFASFGVLAFIFGVWLKLLDKKKKYGLELPNVKRE